MTKREEGNIALGNKLDKVAYLITIAVLFLVGLMRRVKLDVDMDFSFLPLVSACLNTGVAVFLILALIQIKKKNVESHKLMINIAMLLSLLFLLCYVVYHFTTVETTFCKEGTIRTVYYVILISHIILAGVSLPFILLTYIKGFSGQVTRHRAMAKWVWPLWFYVAITGPITYLLLRPCY